MPNPKTLLVMAAVAFVVVIVASKFIAPRFPRLFAATTVAGA